MRIHLVAFLATAALIIGVWLAIAIPTAFWYPWPVFPLLGGAVGWSAHAALTHMILQRKPR